MALQGMTPKRNLPWSTIHPILLDEEHHLTTLIIRQAHEKVTQVYWNMVPIHIVYTCV